MCYDELTINRFNQYNLKYLRKRTTTIDEVLRASGYNVVAIWEHEIDKNKEMKNMKLDVVERPRIRDDGFYGGRGEPVKLIYDFKSKRKVHRRC